MPTFVTKLACVSRQTLTFPRLLITGLSMYTLTLMNTVRSVKSLITRGNRKTQQFQSSPTALEEYNCLHDIHSESIKNLHFSQAVPVKPLVQLHSPVILSQGASFRQKQWYRQLIP